MSVTHLREAPMNFDPEPRPTDAQVAANWAAQALIEGRYELGRVLANIASRAHQIEQDEPAKELVPVPMLGPTRDEQPSDGPTGNGDQDVPELAHEAPTEVVDVPPSARCAYGAGGVHECHQAIWYDADGEMWRHINPDHGYHHYAMPPDGPRTE